MKKIYLVTMIIICFLFIVGCTKPDVTTSETVDLVDPLTLEEAQKIVDEALLVDQSYYSEPRTTEQSYAHFNKYFTKNYVDKIILGSGNLVERDGKWQFAYEGGEFLDGTFINTLFEKPSELLDTEDEKVKKLVNYIGDGLYQAHSEVITFIFTEEGWKIDDLVWE